MLLVQLLLVRFDSEADKVATAAADKAATVAAVKLLRGGRGLLPIELLYGQ